MEYHAFKTIDQSKHRDQLINDLDDLRKKHEEMKMVLRGEKAMNIHYKDVSTAVRRSFIKKGIDIQTGVQVEWLELIFF